MEEELRAFKVDFDEVPFYISSINETKGKVSLRLAFMFYLLSDLVYFK